MSSTIIHYILIWILLAKAVPYLPARHSHLNCWTLIYNIKFFFSVLTDFYCTPQEYSNILIWLREKDLNQRPPGYEPDELPDCSISRYWWRRNWDSNPGAALTTYRFSRPDPSTAWVFLHFSEFKVSPDMPAVIILLLIFSYISTPCNLIKRQRYLTIRCISNRYQGIEPCC